MLPHTAASPAQTNRRSGLHAAAAASALQPLLEATPQPSVAATPAAAQLTVPVPLLRQLQASQEPPGLQPQSASLTAAPRELAFTPGQPAEAAVHQSSSPVPLQQSRAAELTEAEVTAAPSPQPVQQQGSPADCRPAEHTAAPAAADVSMADTSPAEPRAEQRAELPPALQSSPAAESEPSSCCPTAGPTTSPAAQPAASSPAVVPCKQLPGHASPSHSGPAVRPSSCPTVPAAAQQPPPTAGSSAAAASAWQQLSPGKHRQPEQSSCWPAAPTAAQLTSRAVSVPIVRAGAALQASAGLSRSAGAAACLPVPARQPVAQGEPRLMRARAGLAFSRLQAAEVLVVCRREAGGARAPLVSYAAA